MHDALPFWFWLPVGLALWTLLLFPLFIHVDIEADPNPDALTPLDIYERTGIYPRQ